MQPPDLPAGAEQLDVDDAIAMLVTGDHTEAAKGSVALDTVLIDALRAGLIVACRLPDGRIAVTPTGNDNAG
ncbi:hypothetical protein Dvina_51625 [Dactylosporangium vinaceum]|uniref:Uncharacterized protein n=1 Tax=Dactylosporangium vinaceum TaxID=53362 RepID=A0ABV5M2L7_9ACTN|nr:hypothetical protein [Dactylosporangium vinaceum]UAB96298.1 hypothetical protein Dvina_51625 [Dactylosporangium vinaceum]